MLIDVCMCVCGGGGGVIDKGRVTTVEAQSFRPGCKADYNCLKIMNAYNPNFS